MFDLIFVYGSLRKDFSSPASEVLENHAEYVGEAIFRGKLYKIDWYPGVVPSDDPGDCVIGEVYKIIDRAEVFSKLDRYEGCSRSDPKPHAFVRMKKSVILSNSTSVEAWIYLYTQQVTDKEEIASGDYLEFMK
ncbi:MAG: gamma-glutamylcyclotransferase family protein [Balneolaceae bacterium]|nr:gamma-glutamylcyclotransferase family protein [Balneolaceae bacterium]